MTIPKLSSVLSACPTSLNKSMLVAGRPRNAAGAGEMTPSAIRRSIARAWSSGTSRATAVPWSVTVISWPPRTGLFSCHYRFQPGLTTGFNHPLLGVSTINSGSGLKTWNEVKLSCDDPPLGPVGVGVVRFLVRVPGFVGPSVRLVGRG